PYTWAAFSITRAGYNTKDSVQESNVYEYYFGKIIGEIFEWFVTLFLYATVVTVIAGAGSIFLDFYGVDRYLGVLIISVLVFMTVILNLSKVVDIVGRIGPIIIVGMVIISVVSLLQNLDGLMNASASLKEIEIQ